MCLPPEISVSALPTFARVRDWRVVEELGSKPWRPSYVLREGVEQWSGPADGAAQDGCDRVASRRDSDHQVDTAELCAAGIKLPLQSPVVIYDNDKKAFDPEHSSTPARDRVAEGRGSLPLECGGDVYEPLEVTSAIAVEDLEKLEPVLLEGGGQGLICRPQPLGASGAPELESIGSFSAWFDCMTKIDAEIEATSLIGERSTTTANFEVDTKPVKKVPKLTKREKKQKAAAAVHSHEGSEADVCTDDETEPVLIDEKRKRRMLSNRASAQRSRQRRQDRLDQLEVLTAQLRLENASLLHKSNLALQLARKFEAENKKLMEKAQNLTNELVEARKMVPATRRLHEESHSSPNTCPDLSEIVGEVDLSPVVKLKLENAPDDDNKPLRSAVSKSYVTVDDQMEMGYTSEDADMTADCNNKTAESHKNVQVSDSGSPARDVKMASVRSPVSCKTVCKSTEVFQLPSSLPQESVFTPVKEVPVMNPITYSQDLFEEMRDLFEFDTADDPYNNNEILNTMDQTWLNSFAVFECLICCSVIKCPHFEYLKLIAHGCHQI